MRAQLQLAIALSGIAIVLFGVGLFASRGTANHPRDPIPALAPGEGAHAGKPPVVERSGLRAPVVPPLALAGSPANEADAQGGLWVVEAATGETLEPVEVLAAEVNRSSSPYPPRSRQNDAVVHTSTQPVRVSASSGQNVYWIASPGYAWKRVSYSGVGAARQIELDPGGIVDVAFQGEWPAKAQAVLRILDARSRELVASEGMDAPGRFSLPGFPVGSYRAKLSIRVGRGPELPVSEEPLHVAAGEISVLEFDVESMLQGIPWAGVTCTIVSDAALDFRSAHLVIAPIDDEGNLRGEPGSYSAKRWTELSLGSLYSIRSEALPPGRYRLAVEPFSAHEVVSLEPGEQRNVELRVDPASLELWVLDAATGEAVEPEVVIWRRSDSTDWRDAGRAHQGTAFLVGPGAIELGVRAPGYASKKLQLDLVPGFHEALVELDAVNPVAVRVTLQCEGAEVPVDPEVWSGARLIDAAGRPAMLSLELSGTEGAGGTAVEVARATYFVDGPGRYSLELAPPSEFHAVPRQELLVDEEGTEFVLELARARPTDR